jgi:hypothetical protein
VARRLSLPLLAAVLVAGCGAERVTPPDPSRPFTTAPPVVREFPAAGIRVEVPGDLPFALGEPPLVASTSSGSATIAIWRYPRSEPLPEDEVALDDADQRLQEAARTRNPEFQLERSRRVTVGGVRGIELLGSQPISGHERQVRSTHLYAEGGEIVVDAYAAPRDFELVDRALFRPLLRSMEIQAPEGG